MSNKKTETTELYDDFIEDMTLPPEVIAADTQAISKHRADALSRIEEIKLSKELKNELSFFDDDFPEDELTF